MSIELYNVDCMDYMLEQPDKAFDLAIVDPPYGIGEDGSKSGSRGKERYTKNNRLAYAITYKPFEGGDKKPPTVEYFKELQRISKNQILWGANHYISRIPYDSACWLVWDKENSGDFADCELAWTSFKTAVRQFRFKWSGMLQANMKNKERRIHPTQKPMRLYQWILTNYAKPGQRILDTHLGSGSSAIAAHYFGVDFVGCEIDEHYFNLAKQRIDQETRQTAMF